MPDLREQSHALLAPSLPLLRWLQSWTPNIARMGSRSAAILSAQNPLSPV